MNTALLFRRFLRAVSDLFMNQMGKAGRLGYKESSKAAGITSKELL